MPSSHRGWVTSSLAAWLLLGCLHTAEAHEPTVEPGPALLGENAQVDVRRERFSPVGPERPRPWVWVRGMVGTAGWPSGLIADTRAQVRAPLHRSSSILFRNTFVGAGGRVAVSPAFVDLGPRLSTEPIGFFDVDFQGGAVVYWPSSSGMLPYYSVGESTREQSSDGEIGRNERFRDPDTTAHTTFALYGSAMPTLKGELGPVQFWSSWAFTWFHAFRPEGEDSPLTYEAYWDRLIRWEGDLIFHHEAAVVAGVLDGVNKPALTLGPTLRHRWTLESGDASLGVGGLVILQPSPSPAWPTFLAQALVYVQDEDRVGREPYVGVAMAWMPTLPLGR